jgi:Domain of unknown function (DUF4185)
MRAAANIGRVGALAVALGVGAAVATGHGVAWADDTTNPAGSTSHESPAPDKPDTPNEETGSNEPTAGHLGATGSTDGTTESKPSAPSTAQSGITTTVGNGRQPTHRASLRDRLGKLFDPPARDAADGHGATAGADPATVEQPPVSDDGPAAVEQAVVNDDEPAKGPRQEHQSARTSAPIRSTVASVAPEPDVRLGDQQIVHTTAAQQKQLTAVTEPDVANGTTANATTVTMSAASAEPATPTEEVAVMTAAAVAPAPPTFSVTTLVNNLLAAVGMGPFVGTSPAAPDVSPLAWVMLAVARREFGILGNTSTASGEPTSATFASTSAATDASLAAVTAAPATTFINWVTGPSSPNATPARFSVAGTDLGIMWDNGQTGANRQVLIAFGDTFSQPGMTGEWRSNVLFRSADRMLSDANGLFVPAPQFGNIYAGSPVLADRQNFSKQLVYGIPGTIGLLGIPQFFGSEVTIIPTAGVSVPGAGVNGATRQYMNVMSVRQWGPAGMWTTNYSAIAYSDDNGENWVIDENTIRSAGFLRTFGHPYVFGNENFQQGAFVRPPEGSPDAEAGYIYSFGTPAGRFGPAYVSRVNENQIQNLSAYEYWDGQGWVQGDPSAAVPVFAGEPSPFSDLISLANNLLGLFGIPVIIPSGDASEMSVQYNEYLDQYVVLYTDGGANVVMRTAPRPEGPWSEPITLATSTQYPGLYAPMIHPWSSTGYLLDDNGNPEDPKYLYWNLSQWDQYNVRLMRTDLSAVQV